MFGRTAELYDLFYAWKDYASEAERLRGLVLERQPTASSLLDVACGTGAHLTHLRRSFAVEGVDIDPALLAVARRRLPDVPFHEADMRELDLGRSFDVVTCLFSSIGYVQTVEGLQRAVGAMARHVSPGGVLVVEPWFTPETFDPDHLGDPLIVEAPGIRAVRMNGGRVEDRRSILDLHYLIGRPGRVEHIVEEHALGLFDHEDMRSALETTGLAVEHDPDGLMGRGLWIGTRES
jgi:ubiquinone/menaquinone biosynthesis C-methylase UbiE